VSENVPCRRAVWIDNHNQIVLAFAREWGPNEIHDHTMTKPLAILVGFIGKLPFAGMSFYNLHYIGGLQALGYEVHYVECNNEPCTCYDPVADQMTDDPTYAVEYLRDVLPRFGVAKDRISFIDRQGRCHGAGWDDLRRDLGEADFLLTLCEAAWQDEFELCSRRAFVDGDPLFTQASMLDSTSAMARALGNYDTLFTYATRMGADDCTVPSAGRKWIPTRPVVATRYWEPAPSLASSPVAGLVMWTGGTEVTLASGVYGFKNREFEKFMELPRRTSQNFVLAVGGAAPRERLRASGWKLLEPLQISGTLEAYQAFLASCRADLGIAKHAYVASRSGWFSDRSTCYLAAGRPVLHQETGFTDWLPPGKGVLAFSTIEEVLDGLERLDADYELHARAARAIAEEHFEAATVVGRMLDDARLR
jgi:hypothetical protein